MEAARYFAQNALPSHEKQLREALAQEPITWIRGALGRALARISPNDAPADGSISVDRDDLPEGFAAQVFAEALETTTSQLIHEIEPLLGIIRLSAEREVANFETSDTRRGLDRLDDFLAVLSRLRQAASPPKIEEFVLDDLVQRCVQEARAPAGIQFQKSGPQHCIVEGDSSLVSLCLINGLRNAVDATVATDADYPNLPIVISWGTTDKDYWISIVDVGIGFKGNLTRAFDIGSTTKPDHFRDGSRDREAGCGLYEW